MSCQICYNAFDHSKHKPYFLSCPHTFCLECLDRLADSKCPTCKKQFNAKYPNLALLEFIPESTYDTAKHNLERTLNEANELKKIIVRDYEQLLSENLNKIKSLKRNINTSANEMINLIKLNQTKLLKQANCYEQSILKQIEHFKLDDTIDDKIAYTKLGLSKNGLDESELTRLNSELNEMKLELIKIKKMSRLNNNYEFIKYKTINSETGAFGEITSNETVSLTYFLYLMNFFINYVN